MSAVAIVPARYASTRFPGKALARIAGLPMLQRVVEGARQAKRVREVIVATDDERIAEACRAFGAPVAMTSPDHPTGTDRLAEASRGLSDAIVVNVQGDEPLIEGFVVDAAVAALEESPETPMSTVVHRAEPDALADPNRVKVVLDRRGFALYFSRAAIPYRRDAAPDAPLWQHVGLYAYRREFLQRFVGLGESPLERAEALEQLRALEHGHRIRAAVVAAWCSLPVHVPEAIARGAARRAGRPAR
jgi:3-deoxy-manno-octulosonate cytidylyltransferase (CMP-KDO synthetase)